MDKEKLLKIIQDDDLELLKVKPKPSAITPDDRLLASFHAINEFVKVHGREPKPGNEPQEHQLYARLKGIRESKEKIQALMDHDEHDLLKIEIKEIKSISDVFGDDDLGILDDSDENIFQLKHIPKETNMPDYIARRKSCKDFEKFEILFKQCQEDLRLGKRMLRPFAKEQKIDKGYFFVLKGVLLYVAEIGERQPVKGKVNARLRCIFENATESDMLLRSLAAELYKDGRRITEHGEKLLDELSNVTKEDQETGYIYILKSLSENNEIKKVNNLYKIGYSHVSPEERIKTASQEPTFLMSPVSIVAAYRCFNINTQKFELLLHTFFGSACLNIDIFDQSGNRHSPREWFVAPFEVIEQAIHFLMNGEIVNYRYDTVKKIIVGK